MAGLAASRRGVGALLQVGVDERRRRARQGQEYVARGERGIDAGLARMHRQAVGMRAKIAGVTPITRETSLTVSNGAFDGFCGRPAGLVVARLRAVGATKLVGIAPVLDRIRDALRRFLVRAADVLDEPAQERLGAALMSMRADSSSADPLSVTSPSSTRARHRRGPRSRHARARELVRQSLDAAVGGGTGLPERKRVARRQRFAAHRDANPLAITVSMIVSQRTMITAIPCGRCKRRARR
jgi:hypothetical protein